MKSGSEEGPQLKSPRLTHYFKLETSQSAKRTPEGANIIKYSYEYCAQSILFYIAGVHWIYHCQYYPAIWGVISNTLPLWKKNSNTLPRDGMNWKIRLKIPLSPRHCPRAISRASGCKLPQGAYFPIHPDSRQCNAFLFSRARVYWKLHPKEPGSIDRI